MKPGILGWMLLTLISASGTAWARLNVVATLPDYGALAEAVGGDQVDVTTLARGTEDPHFVDARPSFVRALNRADVLIEGGAELEIGWLPPLVNNARNARILADAPGHVILSKGIQMLEVPTGPIDRSMGDVHPLGNPHYNLDPANGPIMAATIAKALAKVDPSHAALYRENAARLSEQLANKIKEWTAALAPYRGTRVVTYHKSFDYLLERFGFELVGTIEPRPGIEPSATHVNGLLQKMKDTKVRLILCEPNRPRKTPGQLAAESGAKLVILPALVNGADKVTTYLDLFDYNVRQLVDALK